MRALLLVFVLSATAHAQSGFAAELTSDKDCYAYGETITLRYTLVNETDEEQTLTGPSVGFVKLRWGSLVLPGFTAGPDVPRTFAAGWSKTWIWVLRPQDLGIPDTDGNQTITSFVSGPESEATVTVQAPTYLGGLISVSYDEVDADSVAALRESINGEVIEGEGLGTSVTQTWRVSGITVADAVARLSGNATLQYAEATFAFVEARPTPTEGAPTPAVVTAPSPNPTASQATFTVRLARSGPALIDVVDLLGRRVAVLRDGPLAGGLEQTFTVSVAGLPTGTYLVRVLADGVRQSHRVTVAR